MKTKVLCREPRFCFDFAQPRRQGRRRKGSRRKPGRRRLVPRGWEKGRAEEAGRKGAQRHRFPQTVCTRQAAFQGWVPGAGPRHGKPCLVGS